MPLAECTASHGWQAGLALNEITGFALHFN